MQKFKYWFPIIVSGMLGILFFIGYIIKYQNENKIKEKFTSKAVGKVISKEIYDNNHKVNYSIEFIHGADSIFIHNFNQNDIEKNIGDTVLVLYNSDDPYNESVINTPSEIGEYGFLILCSIGSFFGMFLFIIVKTRPKVT